MTAIFDADGTLLDSMPIWQDAGKRYLASRGRVPEAGLDRVLLSMNMEESGAYLKERYRLTESIPEINAAIVDIVAEFYRREVPLKPGAADFLAELAKLGVPMAIATAGDRELLMSALSRLGIAGYFRAIISCADLGTTKRSPDIFLAAAQALSQPDLAPFFKPPLQGGVDRSEATGRGGVVFEDTLYALQTAHDAGFNTVAVEDPASEADREEIRRVADFTLTGFQDPLVNTILDTLFGKGGTRQ